MTIFQKTIFVFILTTLFVITADAHNATAKVCALAVFMVGMLATVCCKTNRKDQQRTLTVKSQDGPKE